jgi:hypothetical protein
VIPPFDEHGNLPPGVHSARWQELTDRFGTTPLRRRLLDGLRSALESLRDVGCRTVYLDGSFVTSKEDPADYDGCWVRDDVDTSRVEPILLFREGRDAQKAKYGGELYSISVSGLSGAHELLEFFQVDKDGNRKGIVMLDLRELGA